VCPNDCTYIVFQLWLLVLKSPTDRWRVVVGWAGPKAQSLPKAISKTTKNVLPFWPVANKLTSVPFSFYKSQDSEAILKPYRNQKLEYDLQLSSRYLSSKIARILFR
jgi:hypothetical protein